jgi:heme/copper-type cytochrome/quinol oxidase subunit 3
MKARPVVNVESLPSEVYGQQNITWWAAIGSEVIEGFVLLLAVFAYFYIAHESPGWPPLHTPLPSLGIPALNVVLMVASVVPAWLAAHYAEKEDRWGTFKWLVAHSVIGIAILVVRYFECRSLGARWDTNAYGSITWAILFSHGYMALFDVMNSIGLAFLCFRLEPAKKHYVDVVEGSFFWYFVLATWIPLFIIVFLSPRWL